MWYTPLTKWDAAPSLVQWQIDFNVAVLVGKWCMSPDGDCHPTVSFQRSLKPSLRQWQDPHKVRERVVRKCGSQSDSISNRLRSNKLGILPRFQGHPCRRMCGRSGLCRSAAWQEQSALIQIVFRENLRETLTVRRTKSWFPLRGTQLRYIGGSSQAYWHIGSEWIDYAVMFMDYIPVSREKPNHRPLVSGWPAIPDVLLFASGSWSILHGVHLCSSTFHIYIYVIVYVCIYICACVCAHMI